MRRWLAWYRKIDRKICFYEARVIVLRAARHCQQVGIGVKYGSTGKRANHQSLRIAKIFFGSMTNERTIDPKQHKAEPTVPKMIFENNNTQDKPTSMTRDYDDDDDDDDDEDFMAKVNVYLNSRQDDESTSSSPSKALEGILRKSASTKTVQFALDNDGMGDPEIDSSKSKQELLSKITRLTDMLREAESQVALEQNKRKKKERNLLKLAKELKKRIAQEESEKEKIEEVGFLVLLNLRP
jgi:hypothetical protein